MLASAEAMYTGDVLEDDPYVDWHVALREEARAAYLAVAAALADRRVAGDDPDAAIRLLLRLLEREPYDETSHVRLVALLSRSGRHGEARRRFQHYVDRMRELELEPRSFAATIGDVGWIAGGNGTANGAPEHDLKPTRTRLEACVSRINVWRRS